MSTIKQTMSTPIKYDPDNVRAVVDEANDGTKAVPVEIVTKASDDSTFAQVNASNGLPVVLTGSNATIPVEEQSAFGFNLVGLNTYSVTQSNMSISQNQQSITGQQAFSITNGATMKFRFQGRRVGVLLGVGSGYGKLSFNVDGTAYGTVDCNKPETLFNVPRTIATDLLDGDHLLTITKIDTGTTYISGFLEDTASSAPYFNRSFIDYFNMLRLGSSTATIGATDTTINPLATIMLKAVLTNTTASAITVTLKNGGGTAVVGPFSVAANDIREITGPLYFSGSMVAIASATGCFISLGVQN